MVRISGSWRQRKADSNGWISAVTPKGLRNDTAIAAAPTWAAAWRVRDRKPPWRRRPGRRECRERVDPEQQRPEVVRDVRVGPRPGDPDDPPRFAAGSAAALALEQPELHGEQERREILGAHAGAEPVVERGQDHHQHGRQASRAHGPRGGEQHREQRERRDPAPREERRDSAPRPHRPEHRAERPRGQECGLAELGPRPLVRVRYVS